MTREQVGILKRYFANTSDLELADMLCCSIYDIKRAARENGLYKSKAHIRQVKIEAAAHARYCARKTGFKACSEAHRKNRYDHIYDNITAIGERYRNGESSIKLSEELGITKQYLVTILNRHGYYINKKAV